MEEDEEQEESEEMESVDSDEEDIEENQSDEESDGGEPAKAKKMSKVLRFEEPVVSISNVNSELETLSVHLSSVFSTFAPNASKRTSSENYSTYRPSNSGYYSPQLEIPTRTSIAQPSSLQTSSKSGYTYHSTFFLPEDKAVQYDNSPPFSKNIVPRLFVRCKSTE